MKLSLIKTIRTNNFHDEQMMDKIKSMWEKASHTLTNYRGTTYGVYFDYENDFKGDYSLAVAIDDEGTSMIEIPESTSYKVFDVDISDEQGIIKTWKKIWELEEHGELNRAYTFDYEKYNPNGEIEIYIAIM
ncbi:GyrI-like domain-containing protein [Bacillus niameyensis]|uniref:GyrI-like domain-containing protein n=1 Tax=Bacillus niameyensis TaxID=1522308 RepID=UPI00078376FA|nr:effector binding domain-containing protein [Bacillus niameyensis]